MRYIAAYVLAVMGGNDAPSKENISEIISSVGVDVDEIQLQIVMDNLKGKDPEELIAKSEISLKSVHSTSYKTYMDFGFTIG